MYFQHGNRVVHEQFPSSCGGEPWDSSAVSNAPDRWPDGEVNSVGSGAFPSVVMLSTWGFLLGFASPLSNWEVTMVIL